MDGYLGEIRIMAGLVQHQPPDGWATCNGQLIRIADNQALYSLLGTRFGGDGVTTFGLPDLRGRLPIGQGAGAGLTPRVLAQTGGSETVTLDASQMPTHNHAFNATTNAASAVPGGLSPANGLYAVPSPNVFYADMPSPPIPVLTLLGDTIAGDGGGNQPHENRMPAMATNYIIALQGIYPTKP